MERRILKEAHELVTHLQSLQGRPVNPRDIFKTSVGNVICSIACGKRFSFEGNADLLKFTSDSDRFLELLSELLRYEALPMPSLLQFWPAFNRRKEDFVRTHASLRDFARNMINNQKDNQRSFIAEYIQRMGESYEEDSLLFILVDLLVAGTDSTAGSLRWAMIYMVNNPQIQVGQSCQSHWTTHFFPPLANKP